MVMGLFAVYAILGRTFKSVPDGTAISEITINAQYMGTVAHHPWEITSKPAGNQMKSAEAFWPQGV